MNTFATTTPITALVDIPAGQLQFVAADRADATVSVQPADASKGRDVKAAEQVTVAFANGVLRVHSEAGSKAFGPSGSVTVTVQLPAGSAVNAKAASAEFHTAGSLGQVTFEAAQATINVEDAAGAQLSTRDGSITVGRLAGDAQLSTSRGDITITQAVSGNLVLNTDQGNITVDAAAGVSAALDAGTPSGRITNSLKNTGTTDLTIQATTSHGDITARSL